MSGFSILMFIFGICIFLAGLYIYTGHRSELLLWKGPNPKNMSLKELKKVGKATMISSLLPIVLGIIGLFFEF